MGAVLQSGGLVLLYIFLFILNLLIFVGLPGGWAMFVSIVIFSLVAGISSIGWVSLIVMAALLVVGEIIEATLGVVVVAGKGATKWGVLGAFLGGIAGAIGGTAVIPVVGSVVFALIGAFAGAVICEYIYYNSLDQALRTGFFAFLGKLLAYFVKFALGLVCLGIFIFKSWR
ncbi:MAG: DUF456 domain-containing protein [Candidatus Krumholzibacteriota bacterium]|nr:DUF456 domain-containing protein [Candidatus Krumholzibacteriota bacterium]